MMRRSDATALARKDKLIRMVENDVDRIRREVQERFRRIASGAARLRESGHLDEFGEAYILATLEGREIEFEGGEMGRLSGQGDGQTSTPE